MPRTAVDLNSDIGESFGAYTLGNDEDVIRSISSANVACGFHAGDPHVMRRTVALAKQHGVRVGAHPGLPDLLGFGRRRMAVSADELRDFCVYQVGALKAFVEAAGLRLQHVKMHGALLEMSLADASLARAMCEAVRAVDPGLIWLTPSGCTTETARACGLQVAEEFYADRAYHPDRRLVSRKQPGAVIHEAAQIRERVALALATGTVRTIEGQTLLLEFDSICVHGDTPGALEIVRLVRAVCADAGVAVRPLAELAR